MQKEKIRNSILGILAFVLLFYMFWDRIDLKVEESGVKWFKVE